MVSAALMMSMVAAGGPADDSVRRVEVSHGYYLTTRPADQAPDTLLPLVFCLHGTETGAADMLRFWRSVPAGLPFVFVAPQGARAGWREPDLRLLREVLDHVRRTVSFDPRRVLLTGHSAGGAMAFRLLYLEEFPATAVVVTANYVPPGISSADVRARANVPVFYAVGTGDLNRDRMRAGAALLRSAGARLTMRRPRIGHVLDRGVAQEAVAWFERICRDQIDALVRKTDSNPGSGAAPGVAIAALEAVLRHPEAHFGDQLPQVRDAIARLESPGRQLLRRAGESAEAKRYAEAYALCMRVERDYHPASLAETARARRLSLERNPRAAADIAAPRAEREAEALALWGTVETALQRSDTAAAAAGCRELLARYPRSIKADDARRLLNKLE